MFTNERFSPILSTFCLFVAMSMATGASALAQDSTRPRGLPVRVTNQPAVQEVTGQVSIEDTVDVTGQVAVSGPVTVDGTVSVDTPVAVEQPSDGQLYKLDIIRSPDASGREEVFRYRFPCPTTQRFVIKRLIIALRASDIDAIYKLTLITPLADVGTNITRTGEGFDIWMQVGMQVINFGNAGIGLASGSGTLELEPAWTNYTGPNRGPFYEFEVHMVGRCEVTQKFTVPTRPIRVQ